MRRKAQIISMGLFDGREELRAFIRTGMLISCWGRFIAFTGP